MHRGVWPQLRLFGKNVHQFKGEAAIQASWHLTLQERQALTLNLLLVVALLVHLSVHRQGNGNTEHDDWRNAEVVDALDDDQHHSSGHLLEAAEHGRGANNGVHTAYGGDEARLSKQGTRATTKQAAQQHGGCEGPTGHRQARQAHIESEVGEESQSARFVEQLAFVGPREKQLHRRVGGVNQQGGDGVVLALGTVEAHVLQAGPPDLPAVRQQRHESRNERAKCAIQDGLRGHAEAPPPNPSLPALSEPGHLQHHPRVVRRHHSEEGGHGDEDWHVSSGPLLALGDPSEDHKLADFLIHHPQQRVRHQGADGRGHEGPEGQLDRPSRG
mmetsp:Transcript_74907/g.243347  ORF Transcript_74907/g.243347 Transcript_74907/m.243347 type:complete len:329 (+) Transcript_74907:422-1408(+)